MAAYICIDLKSFYASVECVERGLDPLNTNLVVADANREALAIADDTEQLLYADVDLQQAETVRKHRPYTQLIKKRGINDGFRLTTAFQLASAKSSDYL